MADKSSLQRIGWLFGGLTVVVMMIAALIVHSAIADGGGLLGAATQMTDVFPASR
jgi:hypothetical protein